MAVKTLPLADIKTKPTLQPRFTMNFVTIDEYADAMKQRQIFPPLSAIWDGENYWLWDGYHRLSAARRAGLTTFQVDVTEGSLQDAEWLALSANKTHGLRRSNEDKRQAVELALKHPRGLSLSDNRIADHCGVSHPFVGKIRTTLDRVNCNGYNLHGNGYFREGADSKQRFYSSKDWQPMQTKIETPHAVHFSSETPEWYTPDFIRDKLLNRLTVNCSQLNGNGYFRTGTGGRQRRAVGSVDRGENKRSATVAN